MNFLLDYNVKLLNIQFTKYIEKIPNVKICVKNGALNGLITLSSKQSVYIKRFLFMELKISFV